jgi:hydroxypyruvate isomerase
MNSPITRRNALRALAGSAAVACVAHSLNTRLAAADAATGLKGRINHSVAKWCFPKVSLEDLCKASKEMGISAIDLVPPEGWPMLKKYGLTCAMAKVSEPNPKGSWNRLEDHDALVEQFSRVIPLAADAGLPHIICLSGNCRGMDRQQGLENCAVGLKRIMTAAEKHKVTIVLEMLNSKVNHKDYMADSTAWAIELVKRIGSERFKLLYDIYHMQIMEGDVIATIKAHHPHFAHYHTAGVPGRHEIDETQELNYPAIMKAIVATGFKGFVAQEFIPARTDVLGSLKQAVQICDV